MGLAFPSDDEMKAMFGFVTEEDRKRWSASGENPEKTANDFISKLSQKGSQHGDRLAREQRMAARTEQARQSPKKTVRVVTEQVREEEDFGPLEL